MSRVDSVAGTLRVPCAESCGACRMRVTRANGLEASFLKSRAERAVRGTRRTAHGKCACYLQRKARRIFRPSRMCRSRAPSQRPLTLALSRWERGLVDGFELRNCYRDGIKEFRTTWPWRSFMTGRYPRFGTEVVRPGRRYALLAPPRGPFRALPRDGAIERSVTAGQALEEAIGCGGVFQRLHRVAGAALAQAADGGGVAEHLFEGGAGFDDHQLAAGEGLVDQGAAAGEVGGDVAQVVFGGHHLELHDRLEKDGSGFLHRPAQGVGGGEAEGEVVGVDVVGVAVDQRDLQVDQGEARPAARLGLLAQAGLDRGDELGGDDAPLQAVDEGQYWGALGLGLGLEVDRDLGVQARAAGLADAGALHFLDRGLDRLAVAHPRAADVDLQVVVADHPVLEDL